jgi:hypothetical protein
MEKAQSTYRSYLLRCWRENPDSRWRASLESTNTARKYSFSSLGNMVIYLEGTMGEEINFGVGPNPDPDGRLM